MTAGYIIDIEAGLAAALSTVSSDITVSAPPLSADYAANLPFVLVTRTGGTDLGGTAGRVYTTHNVDVDVYAPTWELAQMVGSVMWAAIKALPGEMLTYDWPEDDGDEVSAPVYTADCGAPYNNPDPKHPNVPRVTFPATLATRTV